MPGHARMRASMASSAGRFTSKGRGYGPSRRPAATLLWCARQAGPDWWVCDECCVRSVMKASRSRAARLTKVGQA